MNQSAKQISVVGDALQLHGFSVLPVDELSTDMRRTEVLDFSGNNFDSLPDDLGELFPRARVIFLSNTKMTRLPKGLAGCSDLEMIGARGCGLERIDMKSLPKSLKVLTLTDNNISEIPARIASLKHLEKLNVSGNTIEELPGELAQNTRLEMLRIASNKLTCEPTVVGRLSRLAWYSDAGNPFSVRREAALMNIGTERLELGDEIGRSANNRVYTALLDGVKRVAVKVCGADLSTDGVVADEIAALTAAREIDGVVSALGMSRIDGKTAVVMPLIGSEYQQLAAPPNLAQYVRDQYGDRTFTGTQADMLLEKVRRVVENLHAKGIAHGDIYAHNLLYSGDDVLLNDFGAASLYVPSSISFRRKVDERALEILEQEIRARVV